MPPKPELATLVAQLRLLPYFRELDDAFVNTLVANSNWLEFGSGETVFHEGDEAMGLYCVIYGWLKISKTSSDGREQILRFVGPRDTFNEVGAFGKRQNPATVIALENAGICMIRRKAITEIIREKPEFAQAIIESMATHLMGLVNLVADLSLRTVTARLANLLLDGAVGDVMYRPRWQTQAELAARLGTVPDMIQRALRNMESDGAIVVQRNKIELIDREKLARFTG
ncbi:MAG TPA: Crp/Fnr family transcriptional regulator [Anaerolineales bacterium]|nr:Crp/Fnr family transcriptional regulator [Anaerolineales bacterium]